MATIDIKTLLSPVPGDDPCGANPVDEPGLADLIRLGAGKEERVSGKKKIPAEDPNWREVADAATTLFGSYKHLDGAVLLTRAAAHIDGLSGAADGIDLITALLNEYWDEVFPSLIDDGDFYPKIRLNCLLPLNEHSLFIRDLSMIPLIRVKGLGEFSLRQMRLAAGELDPKDDEEAPDITHIEAGFTGVDIDDLQAEVAAVTRLVEGINGLNAYLDEKLEGENSTVFTDVLAEINAIKAKLSEALERRGVSTDTSEDSDAAGSETAATNAVGPIRSRDDAIRTLQLVSDYFRQQEPSSPIPLLLDRAQRLVAKDFLEILEDLTPNGVGEARLIGGLDKD